MTRPRRLTDPETAWAPVSWGGAGSHNVLSQGADDEGQQVPLEVGDSGDPRPPSNQDWELAQGPLNPLACHPSPTHCARGEGVGSRAAWRALPR